jgi:PAS domain S-box-containing protein
VFIGPPEPAAPDVSTPDSTDSRTTAEQALLEAAEQIAQVGSYEWNLETGQSRWSDNLFRIFGLEPGEVAPSVEFWLERVHPDDREELEERLERIRRTGELPRSAEYRFSRTDGTLRHCRARGTTLDGEGKPKRVVGAILDITEQRRAELQIAAHLAVSEALATWETLEQGASDLLRRLGTGMDSEVGVLWLPEDRVLSPRFFWHSRPTEASEFESVTRQFRFPRGSGLPGRAWESQQPLSASRARDAHDFERRAATGLSWGLAFPATNEGTTAAMLEFYFSHECTLTDPLLRSLAGIGDEVGRFLSRRGGELNRARSLTRREVEVLQLAANGLSGRRIADELVVSPSTIKTHFNHIYEKLGVSSRSGAVATALRLGLIQ